MPRLIMLACGLLLAALPLIAQPELVPPTTAITPAPPQPPANEGKGAMIRRIDLRYTPVDGIIASLTTPVAQGGIKEYLPNGILNLIGLQGLNALLVRADDERILDEVAKIVQYLDTPARSAQGELIEVELRKDKVDALLAQFTPGTRAADLLESADRALARFAPWMERARLLWELQKLTPIVRIHPLVLTDGRSTVIDLRSLGADHSALWFDGVRVRDEYCAISFTPILRHLPAPVTIEMMQQGAKSHGLALLRAVRRGDAILAYNESAIHDPQHRVLVFLTMVSVKDAAVQPLLKTPETLIPLY